MEQLLEEFGISILLLLLAGGILRAMQRAI